MSYYRLYSLDVDRSHIVDVISFVAESDSAAIRKVRPGKLGVARELWNLGRKVRDFAPRIPAAPATQGSDRLAKLIAPGAAWRWNPLEGNCQGVA